MMDLEIRVAIAEIMGAKWYLSGGEKIFLLLEKPANPLFTQIPKPETFEYDSLHYLKKYERDLNAMHEVEESLDDIEMANYISFLCARSGGWNRGSLCATAKTRAKMFLEVKKK